MNNILTAFVKKVTSMIEVANAQGFHPVEIRISSRTREILKSDSIFRVDAGRLPETLLGLPVVPNPITTMTVAGDEVCGLPVVIDETLPELEATLAVVNKDYCSRLKHMGVTRFN